MFSNNRFTHSPIHRLACERGVALMLVLASLLIVTTVVVEFAYNTHVSYEVAATQRDRLKAEYLARSTIQLVQWELIAEKKFRQRFAGVLQELSGGMSQDPLCKMFPLASGLIEGMIRGNLPLGEGSEKAAPPPDEGSLFGESEDPLKLEGDFQGSCDTEESKINLNAFRPSPVSQGVPVSPKKSDGTPGVEARGFDQLYEDQKKILEGLLSQPRFLPLFQGRREEVSKTVQRIADWVDPDDRINEGPDVLGGYEDSDYRDLPYKPKNGKMGSLSELLLIPGIGDALYEGIRSSVTVYGDDKLNLCQADDQTVLAFAFYHSTVSGAPPLNLEDEQKTASLIEGVRLVCSEMTPNPSQIAQAVVSAIGGGDASLIAGQISVKNRFYTLKGVGVSGDAEATLTQVLDTAAANPNLWKILYYRVE